MASRIETLLAEILNAVYGEEVRGAIHDAIEECYDDVSTAKTAAEDATSAANTAASNAQSKATLANTAATAATAAATSATNAATSANNAAASATTAYNNTVTAIGNANAATANANSAASAATTAAETANTATTAASTATTNANNATTAANNATTAATNAATAANSAASDASASATLAATAATNADTKAALANTAAAAANDATAAANIATENATDAADAANTAKYNADVATAAANTAATAAGNAAADASTAATNADTKATLANTAAGTANTAASAANLAKDDCDNAIYAAGVATSAANTASSRATSAAQAIEGMTVTSESLPPGSTAYASITDVSGHKNIQFGLVKGDTGPAFLIKGDAYASVEDLMEDVTDPEVGDMYNVGSAAPYDLYRWTGTVWENQGTIGVSFDAISSSDIDTMWGGTALGGSDRKWLNDTGMLYFIVQKIQAALSGKVDTVSGKGLSTNDLTDELVTTIAGHTDSISSLSSTKVDKVTGKGLSTNDFTDALLTKLNGIDAEANKTIVDTALDTTSSNPVRNSVIAARVNTISTDLNTTLHNSAEEYSTSSTYEIGDYCTYDRQLYRCTTRIQYTETWNPNHWTRVHSFDMPHPYVGDEYSSSSTYSVGDLCIYANTLYRCSTTISTAENWTPAHWIRTTLAYELKRPVMEVTLSSVADNNRVFTVPGITEYHTLVQNGFAYLSNPEAAVGNLTLLTDEDEVSVVGTLVGTTDIVASFSIK